MRALNERTRWLIQTLMVAISVVLVVDQRQQRLASAKKRIGFGNTLAGATMLG